MTPTTTAATTAAATVRKRISVYNGKLTFRLPIENDDYQTCIDKRKKIEALAKELGAIDIEASGHPGSTMIDAPK